MKTKEELNALKEEVKSLNEKLAELSEEELEEVTGGVERVGGLVKINDPYHTTCGMGHSSKPCIDCRQCEKWGNSYYCTVPRLDMHPI